MSAGDILSVVTILVSVGKDLHNRCVAMKQVDDDLLLLTAQLESLKKVFKDLENNVISTSSSELIRMLSLLQSIQDTYDKCAKVLGDGRSFRRQAMIFLQIPGIRGEIHEKAEQLQKITSILSISFLSDVRKEQRDSSGNHSLVLSAAEPTTLPNNLLDLNLRTGLTSIDRMVENLMTECESLERQLREITVYQDTSAIQEYEEQNPEGAAFWKDRFQQGQLCASTLRYEVNSLAPSPVFFSMSNPILTCCFFNRRSMSLGPVLYTR